MIIYCDTEGCIKDVGVTDDGTTSIIVATDKYVPETPSVRCITNFDTI